MLRSLLLVTLCTLVGSCATPPPATIDPIVLVGTWKVDLRPKPGAPDYDKAFVVTSVNGNDFEGTFYDTPITEGHVNVTWGKVRIAFETGDRSGPYHHSAVLNGATLEGLTNSSGRGFLAYWSAVKE